MGAKRPENFLYYRASLYGFQCWNLKSRYPGFFFQYRDLKSRHPGFFFQYRDLKSRYPEFSSSTYRDLKSWHPGFEIPVPRIFFPVPGFEIPVPGIFFTAEFGHFLVTYFFFNYIFGKKFIKKNCHQKVTKLGSKKILKSRYPGFSHMAPPPKDASEGFSNEQSGCPWGGGGRLLQI